MTAEQIRKENRRIADRNRRFSRMSASQQRMAIAKDVLASLEVGKFRARRGTYFNISQKNGKKMLKFGESADLQKALPAINPCDVCARGAIFMSAVNLADNCKIGSAFKIRDFGYVMELDLEMDTMDSVSEKFFTKDTLHKMEDFFEYYSESLSAKQALKKIMENVVEHKGDFVWEIPH